jgi:hypothetical protein
MPATVTFKWDSREIEAFARSNKAVARALKKAGGDAIRKMRAESKRQLRNKSRIRAGYLADKALPLDYPKGTEINDLVWRMRVSGKGVPLGEFPSRQVKAGVKVQVLNANPARTLYHAFKAMTKTGRESVFLRPSKARYPMGHLMGPRVSDTMDNEAIISIVQEATRLKFASSFKRLLPLELSKAR